MASPPLARPRAGTEDSDSDFVASQSSESQTIPPLSPSQPAQQRHVALTANYRGMLNEMIEDATWRSKSSNDPMTDSQIGASFWTAAEKDALFRCLSLRGCVDLPSLCFAIGTKQEPEIQVYLSLLRKNVAEHVEDLPKNNLPASLMPPAVEVSSDCETSLDAVANILSARVEKREALIEQQHSGEDWLIDEARAALIEDQYNDLQLALDVLAEEDGEVSGSDEMPINDTAKSHTTSLLRPAAFLNLSQQFFMNNGERDHLNWHHLDCVSDVSTAPALFKSALRDFENIVVSITRRLIQASIFQAMTRLRAGDTSRADWTPSAAVREVDVLSASSMLGMTSTWHHYWATMARRNQLAVYSESVRFNDGRNGTKNGFKLTYEEVEAELDLEPEDRDQTNTEYDEGEEVLDEDVDEIMQDADLFTDDEHEFDHEVEIEQGNSITRRRALSPASFCRAETAYLEVLDTTLAKEAEITLLGAVSSDAPDAMHEVRQTTLPPYPRPVPSTESERLDWRDRTEYVGDWERGIGYPSEHDFHTMNLQGQKGRKRRKDVREEIGRRLASATAYDAIHDNDDPDDTAADHATGKESMESSKPV